MKSIELQQCYLVSRATVETLYAGMSRLKTMEILSLVLGRFVGQDIPEALISGIPSQIRQLVVCSLTMTAEYARVLAKRAARVTELALMDCAIQDETLRELADGLCCDGKTGLRELDLSNNKITKCDALAKLVGCSPSLVTLDLNANKLRTTQADSNSFGAAFSSCANSLKRLNVAGGSLGGPFVLALSRALSRSRALVSLNLSANNIGTEGARAISDYLLPEPTALRELKMWSCGLGTKGAKELAKGLRKNRSVRSLDVGTNQLEAEGATAIFRSIWEGVEELWTFDNIIGDRGAEALAELIARKRCCVKDVDVSQNEIGKRGLMALSLAVAARIDPIEVLNFDWNNIITGKEFVDAIAAGMLDGGVKVLNIQHIKLGDEGALALAQELLKRKCGKRVKVGVKEADCGKAGAMELWRVQKELRAAGSEVRIVI